MGKHRLTSPRGIVPLEDLLGFFSDTEVKRMFHEKTRLALNKSSLSKIPMAEIKTLQRDIDTLAVEMQERRIASRPQSSLHTRRFSAERTRTKINALKLYPKAEEERQKPIRIPIRTFNDVTESNLKPKSPRVIRGLIIVGKAMKIIKEQEVPGVKQETLNVNVVSISEDFCPPAKKFTKHAANKITEEGQCPIIEVKHKYSLIKTSVKIENAKTKKIDDKPKEEKNEV